MNDKATATIRTTMPSAWAAVITWLVAEFHLNLDDADWEFIAIALPLVTGVLYRLSREVEDRWPVVGRVLFGSSKQPHYASTGDDALG